MRMCWDGAQKMPVPLERAAADELLKAVPDNLHSGKVIAHYANTLQEATRGETASDLTRSPCRYNCYGRDERNLLILGSLHLTKNTATINVLIDSGCFKTRIAALLR